MAPWVRVGPVECRLPAHPSWDPQVVQTLEVPAVWDLHQDPRACITRGCRLVDPWVPMVLSALMVHLVPTVHWVPTDPLDSWIGWTQGKSI